MNPVERLLNVPKSPQYLFEEGATPDDLTRLWPQFEHGYSVWVKEAAAFRRDPLEILRAQAGRATSESFLEHVVDGWEFLGRMDIADRASNGLRLSLLQNERTGSIGDGFGQLLWRAYNNPELSDHNHEHNRRVERFIETMFLNIGSLRHESSVVKWVDSSFLYSYWHDVDQLISLQRNLDEQRGRPGQPPELSVKKGHAMAAAVMMLALHKRYARERIVRVRDAWETCAGAAYMTMRHDKPETYVDALKGTVKAFTQTNGRRRLLYGDELFAAFDAGDIDLTSLAPRQMMLILMRDKRAFGFMGKNTGSKYGLHPEFEREFADELTELLANKDPLFRIIRSEQKEALDRAAEVALRADVTEMIAPPIESLLRKLGTQQSHRRPFSYDSEGMASLRMYVASRPGLRAVYRHDMAPEDVILTAAIHDEGDYPAVCDSDIRRVLWELDHIETISPDSEIGRSAYVRRLNRDMSLYGLLLFESTGLAFMRGEFEYIRDVYKERILELSRKALANAGIGPFQRILAIERARGGEDYVGAIEEVLRGGADPDLPGRFRDKCRQLVAESDTIEDSLRAKAKAYTQRDTDIFRNCCEKMFTHLADKYGLSNRQRKRLRLKAQLHHYPSVLPYKRYDSLGDIRHIRTLRRPPRAVEAYLKTADFSIPTT